VVAAWFAVAIVVFAMAGAIGAGRSSVWIVIAGVALGVTAALAAFRGLRRELPASLDGAARRRPVASGFWVLAALLALLQVARVGAFTADPANTWGSTFPDPGVTGHACMSGYVHAADLSRRDEPNLYEERHYPAFDPPPPPGEKHAPGTSPVENLGPWLQDPYEYPPPFLLLPRLGLALSNDFLVLRAAWFGLRGVAILLGVLALARWIGGAAGARAALLAPVLFASIPVLVDLQWGQAHGIVMVASVVAMVGFSRGRLLVPALLLGAATATKIFPGILIVLLLALGKRREAAATAAAGVGIALVALLILGVEPFRAFFGYHVARIASGEAFSFILREVFYLSRNFSVPGVIYKLRAMGVPGTGDATFAAVGWLYTLLVLGIAVRVARRARDRLGEATTWLGLLVLASLRSPVAPSIYVVAPVLWTLTLLPTRRPRAVVAVVLAWLVISGGPPLPTPQPELLVYMFAQALTIAVAALAVLRPPRDAEAIAG
jgi:alpha-1,2-mannosyltransferase